MQVYRGWGDNQTMDKNEEILAEAGRAVRKQLSLEEKLRLIDELQGLTAGGPSMCDALLEDRRRERERELAEEGW
jgi:hypothetical protein